MNGIARTLIRTSLGTAAAGALAMGSVGLGSVAAQDVNGVALRGYPVAIHQGTCETLVAEPAYDLGLMWPRPLVANDDDTGVYEGPYARDAFYVDGDDTELGDDTLFLIHDVDGDGVLDYGLDWDGDGMLAEAERLARPILWVADADLADLEGDVAGGDDPELADLRDTPHAVVIHRSTIADTEYLGCAEIAGAVNDDGELLVAVKPVGQNGFAGVAWFQEGDDGFLGIGADGGEAAISVFPAMVAQPQGGMQATPAAS